MMGNKSSGESKLGIRVTSRMDSIFEINIHFLRSVVQPFPGMLPELTNR
jgi:hypothetical protein